MSSSNHSSFAELVELVECFLSGPNGFRHGPRPMSIHALRLHIAANADELLPKEKQGDKIISDYRRRAAELDRRAKEQAAERKLTLNSITKEPMTDINIETDDLFDVVLALGDLWQMGGFSTFWRLDENGRHILRLNLHTGGLSDNEELVEKFLRRQDVRIICYVRWERGGHHYFDIIPCMYGYQPASAFADAVDGKPLKRLEFFGKVFFKQEQS